MIATETRPDTAVAERVVQIIRQQLRDAISNATTELTAFDPASREAFALRARRAAFNEVLTVVTDDDLTEFAAATAA